MQLLLHECHAVADIGTPGKARLELTRAFEAHYEDNEGAQQYLYHGLGLRPRFHKATIIEENGTLTFIEILGTEPCSCIVA